MKRLAASGRLTTTDQVRKADQATSVAAGRVQGLFPDAQTPDGPKSMPPPLQPERDVSGKTDSTIPPPQLSSKTVGSRLRKTVAELTETTKAAGLLAVAAARKAKLTNITLPAAYLALGRDIFAGGCFQAEFPEIYAEIDRIRAEIARLTTHEVKPGGTFAHKVKQTASKVKDTAQAKALGLKLDSLMRRLGEAGYAAQKDKSGSEPVVRRVVDCLSEIRQAEGQVHQQSVVGQGRLVTPRRLVYGGIGVLLTPARPTEHPDGS